MSTESQPPGSHPPSAHEPHLKRKRILIVDDEEGLRLLCATYLQRRGYAVETCADGAAAWARLTSTGEACDLLMTDSVMPLLDGAELVERVRAAKLPIRILSISGSQALKRHPASPTSVDGVLPKPFTIQELGAAVRSQLEG